MADEPTVEQALAELKTMTPRRSIIVSAYLRPDEFSIAIADGDDWRLFNEPTLAQNMEAVRQWHKEQRQ